MDNYSLIAIVLSSSVIATIINVIFSTIKEEKRVILVM